MLSLGANAQTAVAADRKVIKWLFDVDHNNDGTVDYYWSTQAFSYGGHSYTYKVIPSSFTGISLSRNKSEIGIQAPNTTQFTIHNSGDTLSASTFEDGWITIRLVVSGGGQTEEIAAWKFNITRCEQVNQTLKFFCEDFLQKYLRGSYPNTQLVSDLWPSDNTAYKDVNDQVCVPIIFGTAYIPLRPVYISGDSANFYVLGSSTPTYTITKVHTPREWPTTSEWDSGSFTFTQASKTDGDLNSWKVVSPIIADANKDGTADATGLWASGDKYLYDMPCKFSHNAAPSTKVNPEDVIEWVLEDMGVDSDDIDTGVGSSFETAGTTYTGWGLDFAGGYWYKRPRTQVLAQLLNMCHSCLIVTDKIELHVLVKASQKSISDADIIHANQTAPSSFKYSTITQTQNDSAYIAWQESGEPQDTFIKSLVMCDGSTSNNISHETLEIPFVQDSQKCQKIGQLYYQRKFYRKANISFTSKGTLLALQPDDIITISDAQYGGSYTCLIDDMKINRDVSIEFRCTRFSGTIQDWGDPAPGAITVASDSSTNQWMPVTFGWDSTPDAGGNVNKISSILRFEDGADLIMESVTGSAEANRAIIKWPVSNSETFYVTSDYDNMAFCIYPKDDYSSNQTTFYVGQDYGASAKRFNDIYMTAYDNINIRATQTFATQYARIRLIATSSASSSYLSSQADASNSAEILVYSSTTGGVDYAKFTGDWFEIVTRTDSGREALLIDQNDADQPFIDYAGTSAASAANNISTWTSGNSIQGFIRIEINNTDYWMPYYDAPTS